MARANPRLACVVPECQINSFSKERITESVSLHRFPKNEIFKKIWLSNLGIPNFQILPSSSVCSRHFSKDCFEQHPEVLAGSGFVEKFRPRLKKNSCPIILPVCLPTSQASASTSSLTKADQHENGSMPVAFKKAKLLEDHEYSECSKAMSISMKCFKPPQASTIKKTETDQSDPPRKRTIGRLYSSNKIDSKSVGTQTRYVKITELNHYGTQTVEVGTQTVHREAQMDKGTKYLSQQFLSSRKNDASDSEESDDSMSSSQPRKHLEEVVVNSWQFEADMDVAKERKFIVFEAALFQLFVFCTQCLSKNSKINKIIEGSMITINTTCTNNHTFQWSSQPVLSNKPAGNILTAAAILFSGLNPTKALRMFKFAGIQMFDLKTFNRIQNAYLFRAIKNSWVAEQNSVLKSLNGKALELGGDVIKGSGNGANYGGYCLMESNVKKIVHLVLVKSNQISNNVAMELRELKRGLAFFIDKGVKIACLITDRRVQIRSFLTKFYPQIKHFFDCWHIMKFVKNKIAKACGKKQNMQSLLKWSNSVQNHLHWLATSSGGDKSLMRAKWTSLLRHITNDHSGHDKAFEKCLHNELPTKRTRKWLDQQSEAYQKFKPIVEKLTEDVSEIYPGCQTLSIKAFQSVILQFVPKNIQYTFQGMEARMIMAALHFNENSHKLQSTSKNRTRRWSIFFPKHKKGEYIFSVMPFIAGSTYGYVNNLILLVMQYASTETYDKRNK